MYFFKVYFQKTFLTQSLPSPNFFKPSVPGEVCVFRAFASLLYSFSHSLLIFCRLALPQKEEERVLRDNIEEEDKKERQGIRLTERIDTERSDEVADIIRQIA